MRIGLLGDEDQVADAVGGAVGAEHVESAGHKVAEPAAEAEAFEHAALDSCAELAEAQFRGLGRRRDDHAAGGIRADGGVDAVVDLGADIVSAGGEAGGVPVIAVGGSRDALVEDGQSGKAVAGVIVSIVEHADLGLVGGVEVGPADLDDGAGGDGDVRRG